MTNIEKKRKKILNGLRLNSQAFDILDISSEDVKVITDWIDELTAYDPMSDYKIEWCNGHYYQIFKVSKNQWVFKGTLEECNKKMHEINKGL